MWHADKTLAQNSPLPQPTTAGPPAPGSELGWSGPGTAPDPAPAPLPEAEPLPEPHPAPDPGPKPWSSRKIAGVSAAAIAAAAAVAVVISVTEFGSSGSDGQAGFGPNGGPGLVNLQPAAAAAAQLPGALHGEFVVADGNGGYLTQALQTGAVTAVDAGSLTVASADGYTSTYVVDDETLVDGGNDEFSDIAVGHDVTVTATIDGDTATLATVSDNSLLGTGQNGGQLPGGGQVAGNGQAPGAGQVPGGQPGQATLPRQGTTT